MLLTIDNFTVSYGRHRVLDNISLELPQAAVGLLGPNGAGKSTLIKAILGLLKPESGNGRFLQFELGKNDKRIRQYVGYMPESECLIPGFSAVQYVSYVAQLNGMGRREAFKRAHKVLYLVGLGEARYRNLDTYSTGMKQRLKLAQAIVHDPHLIFLDEPTNGLDPDGREEMLDLIREIARIENRCIILSSHLMRDVERCTEYLVIMDQQKIKCSGYIKELCAGQAHRYRLRVNRDHKQAAEILRGKGLTVDHVSEREPNFEVMLDGGIHARDLFRHLTDAGIQIRQLIPRNYTVEEIYRKHVHINANAGEANGI
ncbi:ABC transporter ATP-binding protein [Sulfidibacter corallicola]|uniref:ABC transporter ATP-binding protein n=1 Tax=Sulfidibacter corallicola TaxID=2818388 RepID=A0A8A4U0G7_SULCO|nr:ABC transporter ATP-binding protein [Sulfidibacter corallicola]QTD52245.1 ABC transporter ATP-binding protein [Sulfidibacter corallicola]